MALIEVRGLTKLYRMGDSVVRALDGVDLDIERGEFVAITGASGSGKSTIMHLLGCLDRPTSGRFIFDGRDVSDLSDRQLAEIRNRQIGFVFQTFNLINRVTALDNVAVPIFYARRTNTRGPALKALERVGLAPRAHHKSNELSGGERQRVAIARSIVNDPPLVLADEPTGNLDSRTGQQIMEVFRALNAQGVTVIVVTHEYDIAVHTRRIVQMRDGKIVGDHPTADMRRERLTASLQIRSVTTAEAPPPLAELAPEPAPQAAPAPPQQAAPTMSNAPATPYGPARLARGANAALILGVLAAGLLLAAVAVGASARLQLGGLKAQEMTQEELSRALPPSLVLKVLGTFLSALLAFVLGIIALVAGIRVLGWMRREPGNWKGRPRVWVGIVLGGVSAFLPILMVVLSVVVAVLRRAGLTG